MKFDVVIIGGGAAGLFCAIEAGKRRRKVLVIERNAQLQSELIADLLDVARIASGKLQIEREALSMLRVVESV